MCFVDSNVNPPALAKHTGVDDRGPADGVDSFAFVDMTCYTQVGLVLFYAGPDGLRAHMTAVSQPVKPGAMRWCMGDKNNGNTTIVQCFRKCLELHALIPGLFSYGCQFLFRKFRRCPKGGDIRAADADAADLPLKETGLAMEIDIQFIQVGVNVVMVEIADLGVDA